MVLIRVSLMTNDVEHVMFVGCLYIFFAVMSIQALCSFLNWAGLFFLLPCKNSLYIWDTGLLSDIGFVNIFPHSVVCVSTFSQMSPAPKFLILMNSSLFLLLSLVLLMLDLRIHCQIQHHGTYPVFF